MASDTPHKQEFRIRDLPTRSVLLFPSRAQIIRDLKTTLHSGPNQIIIEGLAPTVDEHSIKVEGTGSATISEVYVDLLPNREVFEDIYPEESEEESDDDDEESEPENEDMKKLKGKIKQLDSKRAGEQEKINSAAKRLEVCDKFGHSVEKNRPDTKDLGALIKTYKDERAKIFSDHEEAATTVDQITQEIKQTEKEQQKLAKSMVKAKEKAEKEKIKAREKKLRKKAEIEKEKARIKAGREAFWPKKVYRITINLEPTSFTPSSSRRSSVDGDTIVNLATSAFHEEPTTPLKTGEISLSLSYITYSASWSPRYDLSLNTVNSTGLLEYGASIVNTTSETWTNAKLILSTSQTTFSGLSETIPILLPWQVRLLKGGAFRNAESALFSKHELAAKQQEWSQNQGANTQSWKPRAELFGRDESSNVFVETSRYQRDQRKAKRSNEASSLFSANQPAQPRGFVYQQSQSQPRSLFGGVQATGFGNNVTAAMPSGHSGGGLFGSASHRQRSTRADSDVEEDEEEKLDELHHAEAFDAGPGAVSAQSFTFEEGAWEESGMTTTYDVPGTKTLAPSNSTTKHKIAKIEFKNIIFSHIVIGKLRQVAFLKARLRNTSKITLLKGPLGLTLDSSFLGTSTFPRCSSGETFSLPLGVDPSLTVAYAKPTVRRSQTGLFTKEDNNVFTRTINLINTKGNKVVECTVLDQVPVSEDERLKIELLSPRGLKVGGDGVKTGTAITGLTLASAPTQGSVKDGKAKDVRASVYASGSGVGNGDGKWGSTVATTKKGGEVAWNVKLNPGQGVKLVLEYEASFPGGEQVVGV